MQQGSLRHYFPVYITVILSGVPHLFNISVPAAIICLLLWVYIGASYYRPLPFPSSKLRTFAGLCLFFVAAGTHEGTTVEAFVALLLFMVTLKLFELNGQRDAVVETILCYFAIVSGMFFNDSIQVTFFILFALIYNTAVLIHIQFPRQSFTKTWRLAFALSLRALPFMIILFVFFPRFESGFLRSVTTEKARTGLSDEIRMGGVAELADDSRVAFRASFSESDLPKAEQLYWRSIVFWELDGNVWKPKWTRLASQKIKRGWQNFQYTITLEPHNQQWLPTLDLPTRIYANRIWLRDDYALYRLAPITSRTSYQVDSNTGAEPMFAPQDLALALQLPEHGNPLSRQLAASWKGDSNEVIVNKALNFFKNNPFSYTKSPGTVPSEYRNKPVDYFLFVSRQGYCEHYASSLAFLLRAAGVPARLVGGYVGGEYNPYGNYLLVRQERAHVWVEAVLDGKTWQRVDPTVVVSNSLYTSAIGNLVTGLSNTWLSQIGLTALSEKLQSITFMWDMVNAKWNTWVMEYSAGEQNWLLEKLHLNFAGGAEAVKIFILILAFSGTIILFAVYFLRKRSPKDPVASHWLLFCEKLTEFGIPHSQTRGPYDLLHLLQERKITVAQGKQIIELYVLLRYQENESPEKVQEFTKLVSQFLKLKAKNIREV